MDYLPFLQAALNGDRVHPATPHSPEEIAAEAKAAVAAGAQSVHLHPYGLDGRQTLDAAVCAETIRRVRQACPRTTISLTTSADVVEDPVEATLASSLRLVCQRDARSRPPRPSNAPSMKPA